MAIGMALMVGLNSVDPAHYAGWTGEFNACEADAKDLSAIAQSRGFEVQALLTQSATLAQVSEGISAAARVLKSGDIFLLGCSCAGGWLPDLNGDKPDTREKTLCLCDVQLTEDQIFQLLGGLEKGVRGLMISDYCGSGTVARLAFSPAPGDPVKSRMMPSGCQPNQFAVESEKKGLFAENIAAVLDSGKFSGNYKQFHRALVTRMPSYQTPNYETISARNPAFETHAAFTI